jgi:hypothetical protein
MQRMHKPAISNRLLLAMAMSERELRLQGFQRMRALLIVLMLVSSASTYGAAPAIAQLSWISGCWKTEKSEAGTGEHWTTPAGGAMLGVSRTIRLGKLVEYEFMQFRTLDDGVLAFIAQPSGSPPTTFRLKSLDGNSAVFENLQHDFPQRVIYTQLANGNLLARIEGTVNGAARSASFPMLRVDCREYFSPAP